MVMVCGQEGDIWIGMEYCAAGSIGDMIQVINSTLTHALTDSPLLFPLPVLLLLLAVTWAP